MPLKITLFFVFAFFMFEAKAQRSELLIDPTLVLFYDFDSVHNNQVVDLSRNELHGIHHNINQLDSKGYLNNAFKFNHLDSGRVFVGNDAKLQMNEYTLMAWAKPYNWGTHDEGMEILEKTEAYWIVLKTGLRNPSDKGYFVTGNYSMETLSSSKVNRKISSLDPIELNTWYHIASVFNRDSLSFYLNGEYQGSVETYHNLNNAGLNLVVGGKQKSNGSFVNHWDGLLDEVIILSRSLSKLEINNYLKSFTSISPYYISNEKKVKFFPNPTKDFINISLENFLEKNATLRLINAYGATIYEQYLSQLQTSLNISHLPKGLYFLEIIIPNENYHTTKKIIKTN
ncbi:MAG: T9SS type A sorting domain-containing protein [Bacteroidales bacterium]|nr:T9SS type A sorting domain-containing protein [Bacteroidales bacterium]